MPPHQSLLSAHERPSSSDDTHSQLTHVPVRQMPKTNEQTPANLTLAVSHFKVCALQRSHLLAANVIEDVSFKNKMLFHMRHKVLFFLLCNVMVTFLKRDGLGDLQPTNKTSVGHSFWNEIQRLTQMSFKTDLQNLKGQHVFSFVLSQTWNKVFLRCDQKKQTHRLNFCN